MVNTNKFNILSPDYLSFLGGCELVCACRDNTGENLCFFKFLNFDAGNNVFSVKGEDVFHSFHPM